MTPHTIILIPAYKPGQTLVTTVRALQYAGYAAVVVNDGSGPAYQPIFEQLPNAVRVLTHQTNQGKGVALKTGYRYIRQNFERFVVVTADADGQHDVSDITRMIEAYPAHSGTLLLGVRVFDSRTIPLRSKFGNTCTKRLFGLIAKQPVSDTQTGLRAFDDSLIKLMIGVPGKRFEYEMNVLLACSRNYVGLTELPIRTIYESGNQSSHFRPLQDSWAIYKELIKFTASSLLAFGLDYSLFIIFLHATNVWGGAASLITANVLARLFSAGCNYAVNRRLVFGHTGNAQISFVAYAGLASVVLVANSIVLNVLVNTVHVDAYLAKAVTELSFFVISYAVQKYLIFNRKTVYQV